MYQPERNIFSQVWNLFLLWPYKSRFVIRDCFMISGMAATSFIEMILFDWKHPTNLFISASFSGRSLYMPNFKRLATFKRSTHAILILHFATMASSFSISFAMSIFGGTASIGRLFMCRTDAPSSYSNSHKNVISELLALTSFIINTHFSCSLSSTFRFLQRHLASAFVAKVRCSDGGGGTHTIDCYGPGTYYLPTPLCPSVHTLASWPIYMSASITCYYHMMFYWYRHHTSSTLVSRLICGPTYIYCYLLVRAG